MRIPTLVLPPALFVLIMAGLLLAGKRPSSHYTFAVLPSASSANAVNVPPYLPPLIAAAAAGQPETVRRLLDQGADVAVRCPVPHDRTALEAAIWHRQNDIERVVAVPNDPGGESLRNQPMPPDGALEDENYREVIGMLRQAAREAAQKKPMRKQGRTQGRKQGRTQGSPLRGYKWGQGRDVGR